MARASAELGIIGGSGLYGMEGLSKVREVDVKTPFGAPSSPLHVGLLRGVRVAFLARHGLDHDISPSEVNYRANIFALRALGCSRVVSVSACGSLRSQIHPGDIVVPDQLFDFTRRRDSSFFGGGIVAHVGVADPFCRRASKLLVQAIRRARGRVHDSGRYITIEGPRFSTRGESETFRSWGMDIIGMTTCPEAFLAREAGMCYAVMAHVTDYDVWHRTAEPVSVAMVSSRLDSNLALAKRAVEEFAAKLGREGRRCDCADAMSGAVITSPGAIDAHRMGHLSPILPGDAVKPRPSPSGPKRKPGKGEG